MPLGVTRDVRRKALRLAVLLGILTVCLCRLWVLVATITDRGNCQRSLMVVGNAVRMYASDYDDQLPPTSSWQDVLQPYVKSEGIWSCPSDGRRRAGGPGSYAWNAYLDGLPVSRIPMPEQQVVLFDAAVWQRNSVSLGEAYAPRHGGRGNLVYLDGRAKPAGPTFQLRLEPVKLAPAARKGR